MLSILHISSYFILKAGYGVDILIFHIREQPQRK